MTESGRKEKPSAFALVKRFYPFARPHMRYTWLLLACLLLSTPLSVISPLVVRSVIDDVGHAAERGRILRLGGILVGMTLMSVLFGIAIGWSTRVFHQKVLRSIRLALYAKTQSLGLRFFREKETGNVLSRLSDDTGNLGGVMADAFGRAAIDGLRGVAYVFMLFYVEWRMALGGLSLAALVFGFHYLIAPRFRKLAEESRDRWTNVTETLHQGVTGHVLVLATASEKREEKRYAKVLHRAIRADMRRSMFGLFTEHVFHLIAGVAPTLIIISGVYLIVTGGFTVGGLFAFFMYLVQMFGAVGGVVGLSPAMQTSLASLTRIFEILDATPEITSPTEGVRPARIAGAVRFENVSFAYEKDRPVLEAIDLDVPPRTMVALVGPSGAGKTTLAQLLPRFYDPTAGRVLVDGIDLRDLDLKNYRRKVGIVPQEVFLFDRTIAENIAYGKPQASMDEIRDAARAANALEFIEKTEKGFDTVIGERGVKISGGQRQRLAIAREILRDPAILVLDEATSALDSESERLIQDALARLLAGRTSFVIAHRLSTILKADMIVCIENGRIVDRGRHEELLARGGLYGRLFESQFKRPFEPSMEAPDK